MNPLELAGIGHAYFGRTVLDRIGLTVEPSEVAAAFGPSGCGKSTLARIAAGVVDATRGTVRRGYGRHAIVFQEPRLLPWATARDSIAYPLRLAGVRRVGGVRGETDAAAAARARPSQALTGSVGQRSLIASPSNTARSPNWRNTASLWSGRRKTWSPGASASFAEPVRSSWLLERP